jgi:hypothetical protein
MDGDGVFDVLDRPEFDTIVQAINDVARTHSTSARLGPEQKCRTDIIQQMKAAHDFDWQCDVIVGADLGPNGTCKGKGKAIDPWTARCKW